MVGFGASSVRGSCCPRHRNGVRVQDIPAITSKTLLQQEPKVPFGILRRYPYLRLAFTIAFQGAPAIIPPNSEPSLGGNGQPASCQLGVIGQPFTLNPGANWLSLPFLQGRTSERGACVRWAMLERK